MRNHVYAHLRRPGIMLLDLQDDQLRHLASRIVAPLVRIDMAPSPIARLTPVFSIGAERYVMITYQIAAIPEKELGPEVTSLEPYRDEITKAIDFLFTGV